LRLAHGRKILRGFRGAVNAGGSGPQRRAQRPVSGDDAPVGPTTPYALRHSAVSIMAASGASLHEAGRRVGHRSVVTTNRYAHLFDERDAEIAEAVDRLAREAAESRSRARNARPLRAPSGSHR
jgi:integrase